MWLKFIAKSSAVLFARWDRPLLEVLERSKCSATVNTIARDLFAQRRVFAQLTMKLAR
jgi:hypothetical protein